MAQSKRSHARKPTDAPAIRGEKFIRETDRSEKLAPAKPSKVAKQPIPPEAIDQRNNVAGADETVRD